MYKSRPSVNKGCKIKQTDVQVPTTVNELMLSACL